MYLNPCTKSTMEINRRQQRITPEIGKSPALRSVIPSGNLP
jgi:hypothetical protein